MDSDLEQTIIRIWSSDNKRIIAGLGFQIDSNSLLTCAYVISKAVGPIENKSITSTISFDYPLFKPNRLLKAGITLYDSETNIAVLEIQDKLPDTKNASMIPCDDLWHHSFTTYGFPEGYPNGIYESGRLNGRIANGWIQIEDIKDPENRALKGFSGSPVWDDEMNAVVGMIIATGDQLGMKNAYVVPAFMLFDMLPEFKKECNFAGVWNSNWGDMKIQQTIDSVVGIYTVGNGLIKGNLEGNKLKGTWSELSEETGKRDKSGDFEFFASHDCAIFKGNWRYGTSGKWEGDWTGSLVKKEIDSYDIEEIKEMFAQFDTENASFTQIDSIPQRDLHLENEGIETQTDNIAHYYNKSWALVIGINDYGDKHQRLDNAQRDAEDLAHLLREDFSFNVKTLYDKRATRKAIKKWILDTAREKVGPDDRFLIFFAGHGTSLRSRGVASGYIIPYGAKSKEFSDYINMEELYLDLRNISAKHKLVILDCCFSGIAAIAARSDPRVPNDAQLLDITKREAWQVITAGSSDEPVGDRGPDPKHSAFTGALLDALRGDADKDKKGYITASELYSYIRLRVSEDTSRKGAKHQMPFYGTVQHTQGDFVFLLPSAL